MRFTIKMISDWHCGSGNERRGDLDRLVARDANGLPYIPGKTIKGVWRDACELAASALGGKWPSLVDYLFGAQPSIQKGSTVTQPGCLVIGDARFPAGLSRALANEKLIGSVTFGKPGVKISRSTGTAEDETLRIIEMVRAGCCLEFVVAFDPPLCPPLEAACHQLLLAGAMLVDDLGGKRNRGAGRCQLTTHDVELMPQILQGALAGIPSLVEADAAPTPGTGRISPKKRTLVRMRLDSRVIVPEKVLGNVVRCRDTIPGGMILAALAKHNKDLWNWVHAGQIRVTDATPVPQEGGHPGRPVPFSFHTKKDSEDPRYWNLLVDCTDAPANEGETEGEPQFKGSRGEFVGPLVGKTVHRKKAKQTHKTHNTVDDDKGRPSEDVGGVYTYMALAPGQEYAFYVDCNAGVGPTIPKEIRIGLSKNVEYGRCLLHQVGDAEDLPQVSHAGGDTLDLWLLSDTLLYDEQLRPDPTEKGLKTALEQVLGVPVEIDRAFLRQTRREGWHSGWGLAQPSLPCLAAGGVARVKVSAPVTATQLQELAAFGLGERTAEGMGMVSINDPLLKKCSMLPLSADQSDREPEPILFHGTQDAWEESYLQLVEKEACRKLIRDQALARAKVFGLANYMRGAPKAQLGSIRSAFQRLDGPGSIDGWFAKLQSVGNRVDKWDGGTLTAWKRLSHDSNQIWMDLGSEVEGQEQGQPIDLPCRADRVDNLKGKLWRKAVLMWVDALAKAARVDRSTGQNGGEPQ